MLNGLYFNILDGFWLIRSAILCFLIHNYNLKFYTIILPYLTFLSERVMYGRLNNLREKNLKKKAFEGFHRYRYFKYIKSEKNKIADNFRRSRNKYALNIGNNVNVS